MTRTNLTFPNCALAALAFPLILATPALAADYALSPDGSAVVRLVPQGVVGANGLSGTPLPGGYTTAAGSAASTSVTGYTAGFSGGNGGAQFTALYNNGGALGANQSLSWVQVINTNLPLGGAVSPYLDNANNPATPFYSFTNENRNPSLPANQINFYDYSTRSPASLATTNPITWNASLYPVITTSGSTALTVENGVSWGWTMKKATVGSTSATFQSPSGGVVTGVGTNNFTWGVGQPDVSSLTFTGQHFDTTPNTPFVLGELTYHNGTISTGTGADAVDFDTDISFDNVPEKNFDLSTTLQLINTVNTDDPIASADQVVLGNFGFTFNVLEGATASVDVLATLTTNLTGTPSGAVADSLFSPVTFDPSPSYTLKIVGLVDPSQGGFVTGVPELSTWAMILLALPAFALLRGRRKMSLA
jgi:hypothetical protein